MEHYEHYPDMSSFVTRVCKVCLKAAENINQYL